MKLHQAILAILDKHASWLTASEIAEEVQDRGLYLKRDGAPATPSQIQARIRNYPGMFNVNASTSPARYSLVRRQSETFPPMAAAPTLAVHCEDDEDERPSRRKTRRTREKSDERYVLDLVSDVLGVPYSWQHTFPDLAGDPGVRGNRRTLPVDAFYPSLDLIVEYREKQHFQRVAIMDQRMTISGVPRSVQRRKYDEARQKWAETSGIRVLEIRFDELVHDRSGKLLRHRDEDRAVVAPKDQAALLVMTPSAIGVAFAPPPLAWRYIR